MKTDKKKQASQNEIKHEDIFTAAKNIFLKQGFKSTSMDAIAAAANVSKRTVYQHYGNKEELFQAMLSEHWNRVFEFNTALFDDGKSIKDNLKNFSTLFLKFIYQQETIDLFRVLIAESNQFPDLLNNILVDEKAPFTNALIVFLKNKKKNNQLNILDAERAAAYFMGLLKEYHFWPMMLGFTKKKKLANPKILVEEAVNLFLKAYAGPKNR